MLSALFNLPKKWKYISSEILSEFNLQSIKFKWVEWTFEVKFNRPSTYLIRMTLKILLAYSKCNLLSVFCKSFGNPENRYIPDFLGQQFLRDSKFRNSDFYRRERRVVPFKSVSYRRVRTECLCGSYVY